MTLPSRGAVPLNTEAAGFAPPDAFGPFRVLHQVGAGTLGPVFRAFDAERDRLVAVKLFRLELPPERMHQLVAECERLIAAGVTHPAIVAPIATGTNGIIVYLVQDFIPADSLDVVVRDHGPARPADALLMAMQLAEALDMAAAAGIHHGALHPRDVLLSPDEARLTGLGIAQAIEKIGMVAPVRRPYSPPERIAGGSWDRRADVFSLAALAHEMLWGRRVTGVGNEAAASLIELGGGTRESIRAVFARGLAAEPSERFETAGEFAAALTAAYPAVTISHQSPITSHQSRVSSLRSPTSERRPGTGDRGLTTDEPMLPLDADQPVATPDLAAGNEPVAGPPAVDDLIVEPVVTESSPVDDFEFRHPDDAVYADVEVPTAIEPGRTSDVPAAFRAGTIDRMPLTSGSSTLFQSGAATDLPSEQSRLALFPIAAALAIGVALGFGGGYVVGGRQGATPSHVTQAAPVPSLQAGAGGREYTEGAVKEPDPAPSGAVRLKPDTSEKVRLRQDTSERVRLKPDTTEETKPDQNSGSVRLQPDHKTKGRLKTDATSGRRTSASSALAVVSRPAGARVFLDGKLVGSTPLSLPAVGTGPHLVRLERDGYRRWSTSIRVAPGRNSRVAASLER